jgi:hypothetical protein
MGNEPLKDETPPKDSSSDSDNDPDLQKPMKFTKLMKDVNAKDLKVES